MLLLIFQVFLAVTIAKSAFEESLEPNDTMISETFAQISRISLDLADPNGSSRVMHLRTNYVHQMTGLCT